MTNIAATSPEIDRLRRQLQDWRNRHPRPRRLPDSLWAAAVELARRHGVHRTARALGLDYTGLKNRLENNPVPEPAAPAAFVELLAAQPSRRECTIEVESARGKLGWRSPTWGLRS
jgi:hypothetical protein